MLRSPHKGAVNRKENSCKAKSRDQRKGSNQKGGLFQNIIHCLAVAALMSQSIYLRQRICADVSPRASERDDSVIAPLACLWAAAVQFQPMPFNIIAQFGRNFCLQAFDLLRMKFNHFACV